MASLSRNLIANFVGRSWTAVLGILLIPVYIKFMGIESYGLVGFYLTLNSVLNLLDLGIGSTMTRELARRSVDEEYVGSQRDLVRTLELIYWAIAILVGIIVFLCAPLFANSWIKSSLSPQTVLRTIQIMGMALALQFPMSLYEGGLMGLQKQVLVNILLAINGTLRGGGAVIALYLISPTIQVFFGWQIISSMIGSFSLMGAMWMSLPKSDRSARFKNNILKDVWKYAAAISANALIGIILAQLDKIILSRMLPLKTFAYYTIASTVSSAVWMIIVPFNASVFPSLVQFHEKNDIQSLKDIFHKSSQILSVVLVPVCAVMIIFSRQILLVWLHDPGVAENAYLIVSLLVFGTMLNGLVSLPANSAPAFGWPLLITYTNCIQAIIIIPLITFMVYKYQGIGAGIAWVIMNSTYIIFMVPYFFKRYLRNEQKKWYVDDIALPVAAGFLVCTIFYFLMPAMSNHIVIFIWVVISGVFTLIGTGLTIPLVRHTVLNNFKKNIG